MLASLALIPVWLRQRRELPAFLASAAFLASMLAATAADLYPKVLTSTLSPEYDLDVTNAAAGAIALRIGFLVVPAVLLAIGYFVYLFRSFRGKVRVSDDSRGVLRGNSRQRRRGQRSLGQADGEPAGGSGAIRAAVASPSTR